MANWYCEHCSTVGDRRHFLDGCPRCGSEDVFEDEPIKCGSCERAFGRESFPGLQTTDRCPNCERQELEKKPPRAANWPPPQY